MTYGQQRKIGQVMEEKINPDNVELASVTEKGYLVYTPEKLTEVLQRL